MLPSAIEVEYNIQKNRNCPLYLPEEFREIFLDRIETKPVRQFRFLIWLADTLIKTGTAIKNAQMNVSEQKIYS